MINIEKLKEKRDYLLSLGPLNDNQENQIRNDIIIGNTRTPSYDKKAYTREEKLLCIEGHWNLNKGEMPRSPLYYYYELYGIISVYHQIQNTLIDEKTGYYQWTITEDELKWINYLILQKFLYLDPSEKGNYRIGENDKLGRRLLPARQELELSLLKLIHWYETIDTDFFTKISMFHLIFEEEIHPFYEGNGRTGRMLLNLELSRNGYPMICLKYSNPNKYNRAFYNYRKFSNINTMRNLIIQQVDTELDKRIAMKL